MSFIDQKAREISRPTLVAVASRLDKWHITPNMATYFGMVLTTGVAVLAALGEIRWAGVAYIFAAVWDAVDGTLARVTGKGSRFGAFLDSTIDRFEESVVFLGLAIYYARVGGLYELPLIVLATTGSLMVSYTRARAEALGVSCKVGFMSRIPRVVVMIIGMILDQMLITLIILSVTSLYTAFHRMYHVWRMTGGEASGWGPVQEPFEMPGPPPPPAKEDETSEADGA
jgi:CDP-diacylglycerol--glycerol-3-phosphate 3-phosphatidyltransferase